MTGADPPRLTWAPEVPKVPWEERDAPARIATLTTLLALVTSEALQGETVESVLQRIVDCIVSNLPVAIASIILLNEQRTHFVEEVFAGKLDLELPADLPWPVAIGAAGRCARSGEAQLLVDPESDPDYVPGNRAVAAVYLVPIRHGARLHGVLNLESTERGFFTAEVRTVFDAIAVQIAGAIHLARVVRELELANRRLERLSMLDGLTGIANRRCFDDQLARQWEQHARSGQWLALVLADVDLFKALNDRCGHVHGDDCLRHLAQVLRELANESQGLAARYGGEEFVLLLPGRDLAQARRTADVLRRRVNDCGMSHPASSISAHVTVSAGVSAIQPTLEDAPAMLILAADHALYRAKQRGRNRISAHPCRAA